MRKFIMFAAILSSLCISYVGFAEAKDSIKDKNANSMACMGRGGNPLECSTRCATLGIYFYTCF